MKSPKCNGMKRSAGFSPAPRSPVFLKGPSFGKRVKNRHIIWKGSQRVDVCVKIVCLHMNVYIIELYLYYLFIYLYIYKTFLCTHIIVLILYYIYIWLIWYLDYKTTMMYSDMCTAIIFGFLDGSFACLAFYSGKSTCRANLMKIFMESSPN